MQLICTDINVNSKEYWNDLIEITFKTENKEYLSITRIICDEKVYIEYNDQVNFIKARRKDVLYKMASQQVVINISNKINGQNLSADLEIDIAAVKDELVIQNMINGLDEMLAG